MKLFTGWVIRSIAAVGLVGIPAASIAAPLPVERRASDVQQSENFDSSAAIIGVVAAVLIVGLILILDDDNNDMPTSP